MPHDSRLPQYALQCWLFCLALLVVYFIEAAQINHRLLTTGHSRWWTAPLMLALIGLAACPPGLSGLRGFFFWAFLVPQLPLFIDKSEKPGLNGA
jgi:hypothetical protein